MARRPKSASSGTPDSATPQSVSSHSASDSQLRRSSRQRTSKPDYTEKTTDDEGTDDEDTSPLQDTMLLDPSQDAKASVARDSEVVKQAVKGLEQMEDNLRRQTKRQKRQLAESGISMDTDEVSRSDVLAPPNEEAAVNIKKDEDRFNKKAARLALGKAGRGNGEDDDPYYESDDPSQTDAEITKRFEEQGAARLPGVNSSYLPLPWKGRLGYACLNTYLRSARPSVFCSRTCRMASIIEHRHPLQDPSLPEHTIRNKPDRAQTSDPALGQKFVQDLGLANARDLIKMLRWNDKYGIKFMRLSSDMFPFASHHEHGYPLAPFASEVLAEAGKLAAELGHRLTMHPGQFTQLGSPRNEVIASSLRDLQYHDELLSLLKLPEQQNRDAVMVIHMGGVFGDKKATLDRFRDNYSNLLSPSIKARLVLENDDVSWSVHDLLPICEELNIPLVLDFHHHNIVFDSSKVREGTLDISQPEIMDRILATWRRKGITPKMHYSEQCAGAVTPRDRRKHSARVMTLPPCPPDTDLMIEAKDKEQAVFELMRTFKLPGFDQINDMIPHQRADEDRPAGKVAKSKNGSGKRKKMEGNEIDDAEDMAVEMDVEDDPQDQGSKISDEEFAMGGPENRVYWPVGMEHWLRPKKRESRKLNSMKADVEDKMMG